MVKFELGSCRFVCVYLSYFKHNYGNCSHFEVPGFFFQRLNVFRFPDLYFEELVAVLSSYLQFLCIKLLQYF
jgi:hypothetical protein